MNTPDAAPPLVPWLLLGLACAVSLAVWFAATLMRWQGRPLAPFEPRRPVPWGGAEVLLIFLVHIGLTAVLVWAAFHAVGPGGSDEADAAHRSLDHPIALLAEAGFEYFLLAAASAVVVAPIVEELLYRVLLQGWLEAIDHARVEGFLSTFTPSQSIRQGAFGRLPSAYRLVLPALQRHSRLATSLPVVISATAFALVHVRGASPMISLQRLMAALLANNLAGLATVAFAVVLVRLSSGATARDLGWVPKRLPRDLALGVFTFLAVAGPVFSIQAAAGNLFQAWGVKIAPDPLALFPFALALGTIYCRTHRLAPAVVAHAALNAATLAMLWGMMHAGGLRS